MTGRQVFGVLARVALVGSIAACEPSSSSGAGSVAPGGAHDGELEGEGRQAGETAQELEQRLRELVGEQDRLIEPANSEPDACEDLCSLATSICGVQEKLCNIADRHPTEANYTRLCREAKLECREAQESCVRCVERHAAVPKGDRGNTGGSSPPPALDEPASDGAADVPPPASGSVVDSTWTSRLPDGLTPRRSHRR